MAAGSWVVLCAKGDGTEGCDALDARGFRVFLAVDLAGGTGGVGEARGVSWGDRRELMSMVRATNGLFCWSRFRRVEYVQVR